MCILYSFVQRTTGALNGQSCPAAMSDCILIADSSKHGARVKIIYNHVSVHVLAPVLVPGTTKGVSKEIKRVLGCPPAGTRRQSVHVFVKDIGNAGGIGFPGNRKSPWPRACSTGL